MTDYTFEKHIDHVYHKYLKDLSRLKENFPFKTMINENGLFSYVDDSYNFYNYLVNAIKRREIVLLCDIMDYLVDKTPNCSIVWDNDATISVHYIISENNKRIGYSLHYDVLYNSELSKEDIIATFTMNNIDELVFINSKNSIIEIERINDFLPQRINDASHHVSVISLSSFFAKYFGKDTYDLFIKRTDNFNSRVKEILAFRVVPYLSFDNYATQIVSADNAINTLDYKTIYYSFAQSSKKSKSKCRKKLMRRSLSMSTREKYIKQYISNKSYMALLGKEDFANSFLTSEWLYNTLKETKNYDYSSIVCGYLKSIEQLLYNIVISNIDKTNPETNNYYSINKKDGGSIHLTSSNKESFNDDLGSLEHFIYTYPGILKVENKGENDLICDAIGCFRDECRNGYFHKDNLTCIKTVETIRANAYFLYFIILGSLNIETGKYRFMDIERDSFDLLCMQIKDTRHTCSEFIFSYGNKEILLIFNPFIEIEKKAFTGIEHTERLTFFKVDDFSLKTYIDIAEDHTRYEVFTLSRNNIPDRIISTRVGELYPKRITI